MSSCGKLCFLTFFIKNKFFKKKVEKLLTRFFLKEAKDNYKYNRLVYKKG